MYLVLVAKLLAVLSRQPHTPARHLHAEVRAVLTVTQLCLLLQTMLEAGLVECCEEEEEKKQEEEEEEHRDLFFDEDAFFNFNPNKEQKSKSSIRNSLSRQTQQQMEQGGEEKAATCLSFRHKLFSLNTII